MRRTHGFTLVEMLVVMALLSLMVLAMVSALRTVGQSQDRVDRLLTRADDFRVAVDFMRGTLGRVSARKGTGGGEGRAGSYLFHAAPDAVAWVGVMPARYGGGGRHFFRLAREKGGNGRDALVLRFVPWALSAQASPDWGGAESRVLVEDVEALKFRYENATVAPATWIEDWTLQDRLPSRISIDLTTTAGPWPTLVIALRILPASDGGANGDGFSVGGGHRQ